MNVTCNRTGSVIHISYLPPWNIQYVKGVEIEYEVGIALHMNTPHFYHNTSKLYADFIDTYPLLVSTLYIKI